MSAKKEVEKKYKDEEDTITIPVVEIFRQLKKYVLPWIILAVVVLALTFGGSLISYHTTSNPVSALVGFYYDGIEQGLDPQGNEFDANTIKTPSVIETTLSELDMSDTLVETVRDGITVSGIVPEDAIDELTAYQSIFETDGTIQSAQELMDVSYYPTSFKVQFTYASTGMSREDAAEFLNALLDNYKVYFMQTYGTNEVFGTTLQTVDYTEYDYPQALDVFSSTLSSMQSYISELEDEDETSFRSTTTGYSFSDLADSISTMKSVDLTTAYSYVLQNNITKDKSSLVDYYNYQIDTNTRSLSAAQDKLNSIIDSINNYQKDSIIIMSDGTTDTTVTQASEAYDELITQKTDAQSSVSNYQNKIDDYTARLEKLESETIGTSAEQEKADEQLEALCEKLNTLIDSVNDTADEYYENVSLSSAYSVLVPASSSATSAISSAISTMMRPLLILEALFFVVYLCFAVVRAFIVSYRRDKLALATADETEDETSVEEVALDKKKDKE